MHVTGRLGYFREKIDIKILLLFILRKLQAPISLDELVELAMFDDGISYFDLMECIADLVKTEHILCEDGGYSITKKGARNGELTENSLPYSVRTHVNTATFSIRRRQDRNALIKTRHSEEANGSFSVVLSMSDGLSEVVNIQLSAVNEEQALAIEKGFRKNAESVYNALIEMMVK